jgi:predicted DCC family thiol-disulfide oxidoreductase YuxK
MSTGIRVATPPPRPVMVFDGDCGFCALWIRRWRQMTRDQVDYLPSRDARVQTQFPEIPRARFDVAVHLIETDGQVYAAAEAVARAMAHAGDHRWPLRAYELSPVLAKTMELGYRVVANHRGFFSWLTRRLESSSKSWKLPPR